VAAQYFDDLVIRKFFVAGREDDDVDALPARIGAEVLHYGGSASSTIVISAQRQ